MRARNTEISKLIAQGKAGDPVSFARLLTLVEGLGPEILTHPEFIQKQTLAFRIGITGPPGAGKSTLIAEVIAGLRSKNFRIGVLAVDPTSPFSGGAILGDRIRFASAENVGKIFIRSLGSRGSLGGLSAACYLMLRAFDVCGFDIVLLETVGVGQVEVEVMNVADHTTLVLVPESGDSIQIMKSGIMEIADLYLVNKADRPGAEHIKQELQNELLEKNKKVMLISALQKTGVSEYIEELLIAKKSDWAKRRTEPRRLKVEAMAHFRSRIEGRIEKLLENLQDEGDLTKILQTRHFDL